MSGRLARYALFQASDYLRERGLPLLLVGALLLLMAIQGAIGSAGVDLGGGELRTLATAMVFLELFAPTAVLIAVNGIISGDRKRRYYRLLFSKPISAPRFYAQAFLVSLFGTLVATLLVLVAFRAVAGAIPILAALHFVLLYFLLFGGVGFLLSAITEYDWIALGVVWSLAWLLRSWFPAVAASRWCGRAASGRRGHRRPFPALGGRLRCSRIRGRPPRRQVSSNGFVDQ